jgi:hypothetical protein
MKKAARKPKTSKLSKNSEIILSRVPEGPDDALMDTASAAIWLGCSTQLLEKMRFEGTGPAYCKVGRLVRYRLGTLRAYIHAQDKVHKAVA